MRLVAEGLTQEAVQKELQERGIVLHEPYVVQAPGLQGILASQEMKVKIGAFHAQFLTSAEWRTAHGRGAKYEPLSHAVPVLQPFFPCFIQKQQWCDSPVGVSHVMVFNSFDELLELELRDLQLVNYYFDKV